MDKNVLLIFPKTGLDLENVNIQMPMGLMCVAAPLIEYGYKVTILDQRIERNFFQKVRECLSNEPVCVGITTMTGLQILYALEIANFIRNNSQIPIVWGGNHPTLTADQTIKNENVDIVARGEGDITFRELVDALYSRNPLEKIKGISWKDGETIYHNPEREFCDLDRLSPVPYGLVDVERYIVSQVPGRKRNLDIYSSRGCPHNCIFCYNRSFNQSRYRTKNIDTVIQEAEKLVTKYNLDSIYVNDDNFFVDIERSHYFCKSLIDNKIIPEWGCHGVRIDSLTKIDFDLLEKSGCRHLYIGIESGSEKILKYIKKEITIRQIKNIIDKFSKTKITAHYNFMVGYPIEGVKELSETIELVDYIMRIDPKAYFSSFHIISPYPGTEFYRYCLERDYLRVEHYEEFDQNASAVVEYPHLSREEIKAAVRRANRRFYLRPKVLIRLLRMIFLTTNFRTLFLILRDQLRLLYSDRRVRRKADLCGLKRADPHV